MEKSIIYQMLPRLWGKGKMSSVDAATLDYIKDLGVDYVWYTGLISHSTGEDFVKGEIGSPYAICNYYDVNSYLADNPEDRFNELDKLVKRTHRHGLKAIIDFVPNHVGRNYSDDRGGIPHFDWYDYDWSDTLKIDYSHPATWETMYRIVRFWAEKGFDGFRCDMVELVPPEFFQWLISRIKSEFPGIIFIAEVYNKDNYWKYIQETGFDLLYDKSGLYDTVRSIVRGQGSARAITWNWQYLQDLQPSMLNFLENHDEQRIASPWFAGRNDHFAALAVSALFNGSSFMLYFGQEVGADAAEGHEGRTSIFDLKQPDEIKRLNASIHGRKTGTLTAGQAALLERYKSILKFATSPAGRGGLTYDLCWCQNPENGFNPDKHFAFIRSTSDETKSLKSVTFLLTANFGNREAKIKVRIPDHCIEYLGIDRKSIPEELEVTVPPFGAVISDFSV